MYDFVVVGAGPSGLSAAIAIMRRGLSVLLVDKGQLVNSIAHFPVEMSFLSTADVLEIGGYPFVSWGDKPTRKEALKYYRKVTVASHVELLLHTRVTKIVPREKGFLLQTMGPHGAPGELIAHRVVVATGYYDQPNMLGLEGELLPHVSHYYTDAHRYFRQHVTIVGGNNSAVEAALELWRQGAQVTLVHRRAELSPGIKAWVRPDIENRLKNGEIKALFNHKPHRIGEDYVDLEGPEGPTRLSTDAVLLLTGYRPDWQLLKDAGVRIDPQTGVPEHNPQTLETNVPGLHLAGALVAGHDANRIFIENGRLHGPQMVRALYGEGAQ